MRGIVTAAIVAVSLGAGACGGGSDSGSNSSGAPSTVSIALKEFKFAPKKIEAAAGEITFELRNRGKLEHTFVVLGPDGKKAAGTKPIKPNKSATLEAELRPGKYDVVCTQPGHKPAGMVAKLQVE